MNSNITRRRFLQGSFVLASGLALEHIRGDIFSAIPASADGYTPEAKVTIVRNYEVGIFTYDTTDPKHPGIVAGSKVVITSRFNQKKIEGTSNEEGKIVLDISELAEDDPEGTNEYPSFNGKIEITKEGYRDVCIPLARISGHKAFVAPTRPLDDKPYFRTLTFNDWDVQYTKPEFLISEGNDENHVIRGELWMPDGSGDPKAGIIVEQDGKERALDAFRVVGKEGNIATIEVSNEFLNSDKNTCLYGDNTTKVLFGEKGSGKEFETVINLSTQEAAVKEAKEENKVIIPSAVNHTYTMMSLPKDMVKPLGGMNWTLWQPTCPLIVQVSPAGFVIFGFGFQNVWGKDDTGNFLPKTAWKKYPKETFWNQYKTELKRENDLIDSYKQQRACPNDPNRTKMVSHKTTVNFSFSVTVQGYGMMTKDWFTGTWSGSFNALFNAAFVAIWTVQMSLGPFPVFLQVSPSVAFNVSLYLGCSTSPELDWTKLEFVPSRTLGFGVNFGLAVTVGVGIAGVLSVSCTGAGYISCFVNFLPNPNVKNPRFIAGYGASVYVTIQVFFFKYSFTVWSLDEPTAFCDTNDNSTLSSILNDGDAEKAKAELSEELKERLGLNANASSVAIGAGEMPTFKELTKNAVIVTAKELLNSKEFDLKTDFTGESPVKVTFQTPNAVPNSNDVFNVDAPFADIVVEPNDTALLASSDGSNYLPTYEYTGEMCDVSLMDTTVGVEGISDNPQGGIKPTYDNLLLKKITSNPKLKRVKHGTQIGYLVPYEYLFRLTTVKYGDEVRTRIVYHHVYMGEVVWSKPYIIDFEPNCPEVARKDMYDVDFDVCHVKQKGRKGRDRDRIYLNVISTTRPDGDNTKFYEGSQAKIATLVALHETEKSPMEDLDNILQIDQNMTTLIAHAEDGGTLLNPTVSGFEGAKLVSNVDDIEPCVMATLSYQAYDSEGNFADTAKQMAFFGRYDYDRKFYVSRADELEFKGSQAVLFKPESDDASYTDPSYLSCSKERRATCAVVENGIVDIVSYTANYRQQGSLKYGFFKNFDVKKLATSDGTIKVDKICKFGDEQGRLIASCQGKNSDGENTSIIYQLSFDKKNAGDITFTQIGETSGTVSDFTADPDAHYLFFAENVDGKTGQEYEVNEETGEAKVKEAVIENKYYIKAMAYVGGLFTRPFVFAELEHAADTLVVSCVDTASRYMSFVVNDITDMSKSISNLYDVRVPIVKSVNPTSFTCIDPFVFAGEKASFSVGLRNDGNLVATGCSFSFCDVNDGYNVLEKKVIDFGTDAVSLSQINCENGSEYDTSTWKETSVLADNPLVTNNGYNVLLPGENEVYNIDFTIPEDWYNVQTREVCVKIEDIKYLTPSSATLEDATVTDDNVQTYSIPDSDLPTDTIKFSDEVEADINLASGEVKERGEDDSSTSGNIPKTGDNAKGSVALAALGAAAAGFVAYSNRRTEIENDKMKKGAHAK